MNKGNFNIEILEFLNMFDKADKKYIETESLDAFNEVLEKAEKHRNFIDRHPDLMAIEASILFELEDYEKVSIQLEKYLKARPENEDAVYLMGHACYESGKYSEAIKYLGRVKSPEKIFESTLLIGESYFFLDRFEEASNTYHKAMWLTDDPHRKSCVYCNLGGYWTYLEDETKAKENFNKAIEGWEESEDSTIQPLVMAQVGLEHFGEETKVDYISQALELGLVTEDVIDGLRMALYDTKSSI